MSESIYKLVKTLNKTEKSRFTEGLRHTKRLKYYRKLLSVYSTSNAYHPELDFKVFASAEKKLINDCKKHFKDTLNNFLISNKRYKTQQETIRKNFEIGCMLMNRMLYKEAKKIFKRAYHLAKVSSESLYALLISERLMYLEKHEDLTKNRVDINNMSARHSSHMLEIENYKEYRVAFHELWINLGSYYKNQGFKDHHRKALDSPPNNSFKLNYIKGEKAYYESLLVDDVTLRFECLTKLLNTLLENKDEVRKSGNIKKNYYYYLSAYIDLCIKLRRFEKIDVAFLEFDSYALESKRDYNDSFKYKLISMCEYAVFINKPEIIAELESEFWMRKITKNDFLATDCQIHLLRVSFSAENWEKCLDLISRLEKMALNPYSLSITYLIKTIVALETKDYVYAESLISTFKPKLFQKESIPFLKKYNDCLKFQMLQKPKRWKDSVESLLHEFPIVEDDYLIFIKYLSSQMDACESDIFEKFVQKNNLIGYESAAI